MFGQDSLEYLREYFCLLETEPRFAQAPIKTKDTISEKTNKKIAKNLVAKNLVARNLVAKNLVGKTQRSRKILLMQKYL